MEQPPTFLFVGTVCPQKGIQDCVAAFRDPRLTNARLEVYGSGHPRYLESLKKISPANVIWKGRQDPETIVTALEAAWGLVLPTRADTSPNVVKEARVVGLPIITSRQGGQTEYVVDDEDGFLVPCGKASRLAEALVNLSANFKQVERMGKLGAFRYRDRLTSVRTAASFLCLYQKVTAHFDRMSR